MTPAPEYARMERPMAGVVGHPTVERAVEANAESGIAFSPRFVARCLGIPISVVLNMADRQTALGRLERFDVLGEWWYRKAAVGKPDHRRPDSITKGQRKPLVRQLSTTGFLVTPANEIRQD